MKKFLTLIVLIIAGILIYNLFAAEKTSNPIPRENQDITETDSDEDNISTSFNRQEYRNSKVSINVPENYRSVLNQKEASGPVLNIYSPEFEEGVALPLDPHSDERVSQVSIFPEGFASELPSGDTKSWNEYTGDLPQFNFDINTEKSRVFVLENGNPWAFFVVPTEDEKPTSWDQYGFLWATISTDNMMPSCFDKKTNNEKSMTECDPLEGDRVIRAGTIDRGDRETIIYMLESINLLSEDEIETAIGELITVDKPLPNNDISSPLDIKGEAVGFWYFEGVFSVELLDAQEKIIAETTVHADGDWMTEEFVPFSATLEYDDAPDDERGSLVFRRANPSGLEENEHSYSVPVIFPPKT